MLKVKVTSDTNLLFLDAVKNKRNRRGLVFTMKFGIEVILKGNTVMEIKLFLF
jgi:hypothetical protein